jgi:hypothetical protein
VKQSYFMLIIGVILFISGTISNFLTWSSQGVDFDIYLVTLGISVSGLMIIEGSFMYLWFSKKKLIVKGRTDHYNVKFLKGYGFSIKVKDSKIVLKNINLQFYYLIIIHRYVPTELV